MCLPPIPPFEAYSRGPARAAPARENSEMISYSISYESITDADIASLEELFSACFRQDVSDDFPRLLREKHHLMVMFAKDGDKVVAYKVGYAQHHHTFFSWLGGVHPKYQGKGIAKELLHRQLEWCTEHDYVHVVTEVRNIWRPQLILNLKEGFDVIGTHLDPDYHTIVCMRKALRIHTTQ